jgi:hypothetical protein
MTACRADSAGELGAFWLIVVVCYCKWLDSLSDARNAFSEQCELVGRFVAGLPDSDRNNPVAISDHGMIIGLFCVEVHHRDILTQSLTGSPPKVARTAAAPSTAWNCALSSPPAQGVAQFASPTFVINGRYLNGAVFQNLCAHVTH